MNDAIEKLLNGLTYPESGCWEWQGGTSRDGYGQFTLGGPKRHFHTHRLAYELFVGPIPKGCHVHHRLIICENPRCCNPDHLEALSPQKHSALHNARTVCKNGHEFTEENTYFCPTRPTSKQCRECHREWREANRQHVREYMRAWKKANREKVQEQAHRYYLKKH